MYVLVDLKEFGLALSAMERVYSIRVEKHELRETCIDYEVLICNLDIGQDHKSNR